MRYLVFAHNEVGSKGGFFDLKGSFNDYKLASNKAENLSEFYQVSYVIDIERKKLEVMFFDNKNLHYIEDAIIHDLQWNHA